MQTLIVVGSAGDHTYGPFRCSGWADRHVVCRPWVQGRHGDPRRRLRGRGACHLWPHAGCPSWAFPRPRPEGQRAERSGFRGRP